MNSAAHREFRLYPTERHWWSFNDYAAVVDMVRDLKPATVLEFGPGSSTLALIEGGARIIDSLETDPHWLDVHQRGLAAFPQVALHPYTWSKPLTIPGIDHKAYDFALIDGPPETIGRPTCIAYAIERCAAVFVPLEETPHDAGAGFLRPVVAMLAGDYGRRLKIFEGTGPLAGAFALLTSP